MKATFFILISVPVENQHPDIGLPTYQKAVDMFSFWKEKFLQFLYYHYPIFKMIKCIVIS